MLESQRSGSGAQTIINKDGAAARAPTVAVYGCCYRPAWQHLEEILTHSLTIDDEALAFVQNAGHKIDITGFFVCYILQIIRTKCFPVSFHVPCRSSHIHGVISACKLLRSH